MVKLLSMACTHPGQRSTNEDDYCSLPDLGLFVVADGMGGYEGGEVASQIAIDTIVRFFQHHEQDQEATWPYALDHALSYPENMINVAVRLAHHGVRMKRQGRLSQMGSTVAALLIHRNLAVIGHVGDSRVYRLRGGIIQQLTRDHSLHEEMRFSIGFRLRKNHPKGFSNMITRALGIASAKPDLQSHPLVPGDLFLLCTDGLVERLDERMIKTLLLNGPPEQSCPDLVDYAFKLGGKDNITAVVVQVLA
jgi:serine/threonine protein phosphatase PrpC